MRIPRDAAAIRLRGGVPANGCPAPISCFRRRWHLQNLQNWVSMVCSLVFRRVLEDADTTGDTVGMHCPTRRRALNLGSFLGRAPTKPTNGLVGFVGSLPAESAEMWVFGFQSSHRLRFTGMAALALIPHRRVHFEPLEGRPQRVLLHRTDHGATRHPEELPPPTSRLQECPARSTPSGTPHGRRRSPPRPPCALDLLR